MAPIRSPFLESTLERPLSERDRLLQKKINDLGLKLEGSRLERLVAKLHEELTAAGMNFLPRIYLSDEWGCPDGVPIIGVPYYLVDDKLAKLEDEMLEGIEGESELEILQYLRHEAGHTFNYAYKLYEAQEWHDIFGPYSRPYHDDYRPNPFSRNHVRHLAGWYAQKHPDEDFAETFAVWLTPGLNWREIYKDWGCFKKLLYVEKIVTKVGSTEPLVSAAEFDITQDLNVSFAEHFNRFSEGAIEVPAYFDGDLKEIFQERVSKGAKELEWTMASKFLAKHRREIVRNISYWTGLHEMIVKSLINHFVERSKVLDLWIKNSKATQVLTEVTGFATTLCMNKLYKGDFIIK